MAAIYIEIDTTDEAMVGGWGWENNDPGLSVTEFFRQLRERVQAAYPGYRVELFRTDHRNTVEFRDHRADSFDTADMAAVEADQDAVREIISAVWNDGEWYVENDAPEGQMLLEDS